MAKKSKYNTLTEAQWAAVQHCWEYDYDEPGYEAAAQRAGARYNFDPPTRQAICVRAKAHRWERRALLSGINAAAQRKADKLVDTSGKPPLGKKLSTGGQPMIIGPKQQKAYDALYDVELPPDETETGELAPDNFEEEQVTDLDKLYKMMLDGEYTAEQAQIDRQNSELKRAQVLARHRAAWRRVEIMANECYEVREDPYLAERKYRVTKLAAEVCKIQQEGERKAWGMDDAPPLPDFSKMTDEQLRALASGKAFG